MAAIKLKRGLNIRLAGAPSSEVAEATGAEVVRVYPQEIPGIKPRALVKEGDTVQRGTALFFNKSDPRMRFRAPAGGTIRAILLGERRSLQTIEIEVAGQEEVESFKKWTVQELGQASREELAGHLADTGLLAYFRERPFSRIPNPDTRPKSIFINAMNTAPFQPAFTAVVKGDEEAFAAGVAAIGRLTDGQVHLCLPEGAQTNVNGAESHTFSGPHPAGNTSVHIHHIDPISPGDVVWAIKAVDVIQLGKLFLDGEVPATKVVCLGGPAVRKEARKHYRVRVGGPLKNLLEGNLADGENRVVSGDVLSGTQVDPNGGIRQFDHAVTVLAEGRERHFLGWLAPGLNRFSHSRLFLSRWLKPSAEWALTTNENGGHRAMVLTGLYDKFLPMRIKTDYLVRAVLAHDTTESVVLGLLETDPEDFALCSVACPSKMNLTTIIRQGLDEVEAEGI